MVSARQLIVATGWYDAITFTPLQIHDEQMIMSHSPLKMFTQFHDKTVLVSGQGPVREIAKNLGFQKVVTIDNLRRSYPTLDMVDHNRRHAEVMK